MTTPEIKLGSSYLPKFCVHCLAPFAQPLLPHSILPRTTVGVSAIITFDLKSDIVLRHASHSQSDNEEDTCVRGYIYIVMLVLKFELFNQP